MCYANLLQFKDDFLEQYIILNAFENNFNNWE